MLGKSKPNQEMAVLTKVDGIQNFYREGLDSIDLG